MNISTFSAGALAACLCVIPACDDKGDVSTGTDSDTHATHGSDTHDTHETHGSDTHATTGTSAEVTSEESHDTTDDGTTDDSETDDTTTEDTTTDSTTDDSTTDESTTDDSTTDGTTDEPTGNTTEPYIPPSAEDYCACMLVDCHDDYHDNWGEDHMIAEMMCLDFFNGFASAGMSTKEGANQECIAAHCEAAMMGEPTCDSAMGMGVCVD